MLINLETNYIPSLNEALSNAHKQWVFVTLEIEHAYDYQNTSNYEIKRSEFSRKLRQRMKLIQTTDQDAYM